MNKLRIWVQASRLRTLPLSISGILVGSSLAFFQGFFNSTVFVLAVLTTISYQILSNIANDYGDGVKGTDNDNRVGPKRALQSGALSKKSLKTGIFINCIISVVLTILLINTAFANHPLLLFLFAGLGIISVLAAIFYTVGKTAYGYRGFGDVFVFLFFGLLGVLGSCFLFTQSIHWNDWLLGITIGTMSVAVLNLNNMRDIENDAASNKRTLPVLYGMRFAKIYHFALLLSAIICALLFAVFQDLPPFYLIAFVPILFHLKRVVAVKNPVEFDPELKIVALSTFLLSLFFSVTIFFLL